MTSTEESSLPESEALSIGQEEGRVLGVLIEKEFTTPEQYPLSLNSLLLGCNQKSNRDPVVTYDESTVQAAVDLLQYNRHCIVRNQVAGSRVEKYSQILPQCLNLNDQQVVILAVLLLRGAQTPGELSSRSKRALPDCSLTEIEHHLQLLAERELVYKMERRPGQKEARWIELLTNSAEDYFQPNPPVGTFESSSERRQEIDLLKEEVQLLQNEMALVKEELQGLKVALGV